MLIFAKLTFYYFILSFNNWESQRVDSKDWEGQNKLFWNQS